MQETFTAKVEGEEDIFQFSGKDDENHSVLNQ
jgi:hypothetical protein